MREGGGGTYALIERLPLAHEHDVALDEVGVERLERCQDHVSAASPFHSIPFRCIPCPERRGLSAVEIG